MKHRYITLSVISALLVVAACGGGQTSSSTTVPTAVTSTTTEPIVVSTELRQPDTTVVPLTPAAVTTIASTTTVDPVVATKSAVTAGHRAAWEAYINAVMNPDDPAAVAQLEATRVPGPAMDLSRGNVEKLLANGWRARPNPDVAESSVIEGDITLLGGPPATQAEFTVCVVSAGIVYEVQPDPAAPEIIVNDEISAWRNRATMVLVDGVWKLQGGTRLGTWSGATTCPAA